MPNMPNMRPDKNPMPSQAPDVRNKNFLEVALGYDAETAIDEAKRCLHWTFLLLLRRWLKGILKRLIKSLPKAARCPQSAAAYARRKRSARENACAALKTNRSVSAVWNAL